MSKPITKVLVANRGEIAVRVMRTCRELGIATVAVYSELDRNALHVRFADEAYALGGQTAAESYLNTEAILNAIAQSGADGVHPGYGFFSENADFARTVTDAGVAWIGPPPSSIEVMGDKISSRIAAAEAGVESVPGTTEMINDVSEIHAFGATFGYPIAIKAAYGGGGRGMKVVPSESEAAACLESAQREATAYFGRDECYMEKYLTRPRHIELQVFCDSHGNGIYISDRDCSTQRRHQKLIEEAPAPAIPAATRTAMGEAAVKVALACGYIGAGTVEMLYQDGEFFFLEMNTRLQVEHCVTEEVSGLDLVALQIKIAQGEKLGLKQNKVVTNGHSIEVRINAEDSAKGFMPSPGTITHLRVPSGPGVRWDGGYEEGDTISQYYDNLVGKLIIWAPDRERAIKRLLRALGEFEISGIKTTIPAHIVLLATDDFANVNHSTKWVEDEIDNNLFVNPQDGVSTSAEGEALIERSMPVEVNGKRFSVKVWVPETAIAAPTAGASKSKARPKTAGASSGAGGSGSGTVAAPMQGTILKVLVAVGDVVEVGQYLVVLEAMKMENNIAAEMAGTVKAVHASVGDSVGSGDTMIEIE